MTVMDEKIIDACEVLANKDSPGSIGERLDALGIEIGKDTKELLAETMGGATQSAIFDFIHAGVPMDEAALLALMIPMIMGMELYKELIVKG